MSARTRVERLERDQGDQGWSGLVVLLWAEEQDDRARIEAEARARLASVEVVPGALYWRDGSEASLP